MVYGKVNLNYETLKRVDFLFLIKHKEGEYFAVA